MQHQLFDLGGELCIPGHAAITGDDVDALEGQLDHYNDDLPPLKDFILPAGGEAASRCHLARTIVRRAERETVTLARHDAVRPEAIRYLNRLSDLLFVLARVLAVPTDRARCCGSTSAGTPEAGRIPPRSDAGPAGAAHRMEPDIQRERRFPP